VDPEKLYSLHEPKARQIAQCLCHHYQYSGALAYQDEANSEAQIALWKMCRNFDPSKQRFQRQQEAAKLQNQTDEILLAEIFGYDLPPPVIISDPYSTFWISSVQRVRGAVIDYFRSERIITKFERRGSIKKLTAHQVKKLKNRIVDWDDENHLFMLAEEYGIDPGEMNDLRPTMLYADRFISLSQPISERANGFHAQNQVDAGQTIGDCLAGESRVELEDKRQSIRSMLEVLRDQSRLTVGENEVLDLIYSDLGYTEMEVGDMLGIGKREVEKRLSAALSKMRAAAGQAELQLSGAA